MSRQFRRTLPHIIDQRVADCLDYLAACVLLIIFAPALVIVAALVGLTSPGPVLFQQTRVGRFGQRYKIWKFRSMYVRFCTSEAFAACDDTSRDSRVTPIGHYLRRWKFDELPQLCQVVFTRQMNLIGPRPYAEPDYMNEVAAHPEFLVRQIVTPGCFSLSKARAPRGLTNYAKEHADDLFYCEHRSSQLLVYVMWLMASRITRVVCRRAIKTGYRLGVYSVLLIRLIIPLSRYDPDDITLDDAAALQLDPEGGNLA